MKSLLSILLVAAMLIFAVNMWDYASSDNIANRVEQEHAATYDVTQISTEATTADTAETQATTNEEATPPINKATATLIFGGDVNLSPEYSAISRFSDGSRIINSCFSSDLLGLIKKSDVFMHGGVFAFTESTDVLDKLYTFRSDVENIDFLRALGTDIVSLANNHSFDYGEVGFTDTKELLTANGMAYVGAGLNYAEASAPHYEELNGIRVAFTSAMRSEKYIITPEADENQSGVMKMYDLDNYLEVIKEASENADFVVAYVHWGTENTLDLEDEQINGARALIDAGADVVIGAHTHTVQAVEYYNGKPIFYSIGDLFTDTAERESAVIRIIIHSNGDTEFSLIPCSNVNGYISVGTADLCREMIERLNLSETAHITRNGTVTEK